MSAVMAYISDYLVSHQELTVFLCLGLGFLAGKIQIKSFKLGATVGTLLVSLLVGQLAPFTVSDQLKSTFFMMFSFVLGYESGPAFFSNLRSTGLKAILLSVFYAVVAFVTVLGVCKILGYETGTASGLMAGAQTQSSVLGVIKGDDISSANATVAYALTYIFGTVGPILFMRKIGPALMHTSLQDAVKRKADAMGSPQLAEVTTQAAAIQVRAYIIGAASPYAGQTIGTVEYHHTRLQIEKLFRAGAELPLTEDTTLHAGDVITVIGRNADLNIFDDQGLTETSQTEYLTLSLSTVELIVTARDAANAHVLLDDSGILLKQIQRDGKILSAADGQPIRTGDHLMITGPATAVKNVVKQLGYIRDTGDATDVPFFSLAVALGMILGSFYIAFQGVPLSLGASGGALLLGLICGWINQKHPCRCYIPGSARWFVRSVGLNLFIAATALNAANSLGSAIGWHCIPLLLAGTVVTLIPHAVSLLFGHRVMKMEPVDILGALCGSGTCTPALNALSEETGSAAFASCYSPAYAVGNILLTVIGILISVLV